MKKNKKAKKTNKAKKTKKAISLKELNFGIRPVDDHNWLIYENKVRAKGDNKGETYESIIGYYGKLQHAILHLKEIFYKKATVEELREKPQIIEQLDLILLTLAHSEVKMLKTIEETLRIYNE